MGSVAEAAAAGAAASLAEASVAEASVAEAAAAGVVKEEESAALLPWAVRAKLLSLF